MQKSLLDTRTWLLAIHIMHTSRKGTSALQLSKMLGVCYKTAWFLCHRIREGMQTGDIVMAGVVEVDEAYIGGKEASKHAKKKLHKNWMDGKSPIMGFWCNGKVTTMPIKHVDKKTVEKAVLSTVPNNNNALHTDASPVYGDVKTLGYNHEFVNHSAGEFVRQMVTTNGIESFWALPSADTWGRSTICRKSTFTAMAGSSHSATTRDPATGPRPSAKPSPRCQGTASGGTT